jgi:hypothetical protein
MCSGQHEVSVVVEPQSAGYICWPLQSMFLSLTFSNKCSRDGSLSELSVRNQERFKNKKTNVTGTDADEDGGEVCKLTEDTKSNTPLITLRYILTPSLRKLCNDVFLFAMKNSMKSKLITSFQSAVVTVCTTCSNTLKLCIVPTECMCVFYMAPSRESSYFPKLN